MALAGFSGCAASPAQRARGQSAFAGGDGSAANSPVSGAHPLGESSAPAPPPAANVPIQHVEAPLGDGASACLEFRPDHRRAQVRVSVVGGSPEARLLLRLTLQKKAAALGFPDLFSPPLGTSSARDHTACGDALACLWTESDKAAELARSWAQVLVTRSAADFYGVRMAALEAAQQLDEASFEWRLQTALGALGRSSEPLPTRLAVERGAGAAFLRSLSVGQFEAEMDAVTTGAQLHVALPRPVAALSESLAGTAVNTEDSAPRSPELNRSSPGWTHHAPLLLEEKDGPQPGLALVGWMGLVLSSREAALLELGLETARTRFNLAHRSKTEVHASWSRSQGLASSTQLLLVGPALNLPSAIDLMKDEISRLVSPDGLPTEQELGRALVQLRDLKNAPYLSPCEQPALAADAKDVASAVRALPDLRSVLSRASVPSTEAE